MREPIREDSFNMVKEEKSMHIKLERRLIVACAIGVLGVILFQTLFYKIVAVLCAIIVGKRYIKQATRCRWVYVTLIAVCLAGLWITSPRICWNTNDRIRLIYQDDSYHPMNMPLHHWALNTLVPEPEVMNIGLPVVRYAGRILPIGQSRMFGLSRNLWEQFIYGQPIHKFKQPFRNLETHGQFLASGVVSQAFNTIGGNTRAVYVISPKNFDKDKTYPVVVCLHGFLGNWQFYQGIMLGLDDYIVISPSTHDLKGVWNSRDLEDIVTHQLYFLEDIGYKIDRNNVHLIGISNGADYGSSEAVRHYGRHFRSVTFIVGGNASGRHHPQELHVYGKDDAACPNYLRQTNEKQSTDSYLYFPCCGHYLMAYHPEEIRQWLMERWESKP